MKKMGENVHQIVFFKNDFQNEATLVMKKIKKQTRGKLVTAATVDVRVFFIDFFCEKCSKMKNEKMGKNGARAAPPPSTQA